MQSNQPRDEEVSFDNIVERESQPPKPPKRKKKKVSFAVWWELYAPEELKSSSENIQQQDASLVIEKETIAEAQETVDEQGERSTSQSESNENQVPFKTWLEEHVPVSVGNIENQKDSLGSEEQSIARVQETVDTAEKEQPCKSKEQPPTTRRNKKKKMPFHIWLAKHAPTDLSVTSKSTAMEDVSPDTEKASISVLQETIDVPDKEESFKTFTENVNEQDSSLPEEGKTPPVTEQEFISKAQETLDQQGEEKPPTTRRIRKKKIPFHIWLAKHAPADLSVSAGSTATEDVSPIPEKASISVLQETIDVPDKEESFKTFTENVHEQDSSLPEEGKTPLVTEQEFISKAQETLDQQGEEKPPTTRRIKKKKKMPFHIWLAKHAPTDLSVSAGSTATEDVSPVPEKASISVLQETIDVPDKEESFKTFTENVNEQDSSLPEEGKTPPVTEQEFISRAQETLDQQGEEKPPTTRRIKKKKKMPFHIWLAKHAPTDLSVSAGSTATEDVSPIPEKASISVLQETIDVPDKEESFKTFTENVNEQDSSLPEEGKTPPVTEQEFISKAQETLDQQAEEKPPTTRRIKKKKKMPFHIWLAKHAPTDLSVSDKSTATEDVSPVPEKASISVLQETIDVPDKEESFKTFTENVNKQDSALLEENVDQKDSLKKESCTEGPVISTTALVTEKRSKSQKKSDQKGEKQTSKKKPLLWKSFPESNASIDLTFLTENSDTNNSLLPEKPSYQAVLPSRAKKSFWKVFPETEPRIDLNFFAEHVKGQDVSVSGKYSEQVASLEKQCYSKDIEISTSQAECTCQATSKEPILGSIELEKHLMRQLDEMFDINRKLRARLKYQKDLLRKVLSDQRPNRKSTGWGQMWVE